MLRKHIGSLSVLAFAIGICGFSAFADENDNQTENNTKIENVDNSANKVSGNQDADDVLTNNKLRAESGSKSRVSIASQWNYNGGTVGHPFGDSRPDITQANGVTAVPDLDGGVNIKVNLTTMDSLIFGETVRYITPLSSFTQVPAGYPGQKFDNYNPSLNYQRIYKVGGWQAYVQVGPTIITQTDLTAIGYLGSFGTYNAMAYDIGATRFSVGVESGLTYAWFKDPTAYPSAGLMTAQDTEAASSDWDVFAYPYLEYKISDKLNVRTVFMYFQVEHTLANPSNYNVWKKDKAQQSVGLGISITRDIFLYPNVQFIPDELRPTETNVALAADINLF